MLKCLCNRFMKGINMKKFLLALMMILFFSTQVNAMTPPNVPAEVALSKLNAGNLRYAEYRLKHPNTDKTRREQLNKGQHPFAVIVTCSDSRVAPEIIFDQGLGDLFVIRNAGNVLDEHVLGSIEYAVEHLGVNLVIIMGHESCGAVGAAMKDEPASPAIESIKASIKPAIEKCKKEGTDSYENIIQTNAILVAKEIEKSPELAQYAKKHDIEILPAMYYIGSGQVKMLKIEDDN